MNATQNLPEIVQIVLPRLASMRVARVLPLGAFEKKLQRLCSEELAPRGLMLLFREMSDGRIRFIIKDSATHAFVHMVEYPSTASADQTKTTGSARGVRSKHPDTTEVTA
ncbi:MAG TPA: hypothetical protein VE860_01280 [Chthoniobacterales bacterium]|jgi:hypothetical protein|nr:hypothetical protein [Chthoniobacterales bacterium]